MGEEGRRGEPGKSGRGVCMSDALKTHQGEHGVCLEGRKGWRRRRRRGGRRIRQAVGVGAEGEAARGHRIIGAPLDRILRRHLHVAGCILRALIPGAPDGEVVAAILDAVLGRGRVEWAQRPDHAPLVVAVCEAKKVCIVSLRLRGYLFNRKKEARRVRTVASAIGDAISGAIY